jgi:hypothetical protein
VPSKQDLPLYENNDTVIRVAITTNQPTPGTPLDITGKTLEAYVKPNAATADNAAGVWKGTNGTGEVVVTDGPNGECAITVPRAEVTLTQGWWRLDVLSGGLLLTAAYGALTVTDL